MPQPLPKHARKLGAGEDAALSFPDASAIWNAVYCPVQAQQHCSSVAPEQRSAHVRELVRCLADWAEAHRALNAVIQLPLNPLEEEVRPTPSFSLPTRSAQAVLILSHCSVHTTLLEAYCSSIVHKKRPTAADVTCWVLQTVQWCEECTQRACKAVSASHQGHLNASIAHAILSKKDLSGACQFLCIRHALCKAQSPGAQR